MALKLRILRKLGRVLGMQVSNLGTESLLSLKGQDFSAIQKRRYEFFAAAELVQLLAETKASLVMDVGANEGQFAQGLRKAGYQGLLHSFEPVSAAFANLQRVAAADEGWHVHNHGFAAEECMQEINVMESTKLSSLLTPNDCGAILGGDVKSEVVKRESVKLIRVDSFLNEAGPEMSQERVFLKLDTQGFDLHVFAGVGDWRSSIVGLQSEISLSPLYDGMPEWVESVRTYRDAGFEVVGLFPAARQKSNRALIELDCLMINTRCAKC